VSFGLKPAPLRWPIGGCLRWAEYGPSRRQSPRLRL